MTAALSIVVGIVIAGLAVFGILRVSMRFADRKVSASRGPWRDNASGNPDGHGSGYRNTYDDFGGGDAGGGGGD